MSTSIKLRKERGPCFGEMSVDLSIKSGDQSMYLKFYKLIFISKAIPVSTRSQVWVCCRSPALIVGSNPAENMDVCLLWVSCIVSSGLWLADPLPRGALQCVCVCVSLSVISRNDKPLRLYRVGTRSLIVKEISPGQNSLCLEMLFFVSHSLRLNGKGQWQ